MATYTRRDFLRTTLGTGLALPFIPAHGLFAAPPGKPCARAMIHIRLHGGLSHLDTFDPKPDAGADYCGPYASPIETSVPGIRIGPRLPELARLADTYALVRSMTHGADTHEEASRLLRTGFAHDGGPAHVPSIGAVLSARDARPFVSLNTPLNRTPEAGDCGASHEPSAQGLHAAPPRYGQSVFGQGCHTALRLIEQGAACVIVNSFGWDAHRHHFAAMDRKLPELDAGLSALLDGLSQRGLLGSTLVLCGGEFGRSPRITDGGRQHACAAFSVLLAGGGFKGGQVIGATDATGERVVESPVTPAQLMGAIYNRLAVSPREMPPCLQDGLAAYAMNGNPLSPLA